METVTGDASDCNKKDPIHPQCGSYLCSEPGSGSLCISNITAGAKCKTRNQGCKYLECDSQGKCSKPWMEATSGSPCDQEPPYVDSGCIAWKCFGGQCASTSADGRSCVGADPCKINGTCSSFQCLQTTLRSNDDPSDCAPFKSTECTPYRCRDGTCTALPHSGTECTFEEPTFKKRSSTPTSIEEQACQYHICFSGYCGAAAFTRSPGTSCGGNFTRCLQGVCDPYVCRVSPIPGCGMNP